MACSPSSTSEPVSVEALAVQVEQGSASLILDVRSHEEYVAGHITGAVNIHLRDVSNQLYIIRVFNSDEAVLYCERGIRVDIASAILKDAGFIPIRQLTGHMPAWRAAKLLIVMGEDPL